MQPFYSLKAKQDVRIELGKAYSLSHFYDAILGTEPIGYRPEAQKYIFTYGGALFSKSNDKVIIDGVTIDADSASDGFSFILAGSIPDWYRAPELSQKFEDIKLIFQEEAPMPLYGWALTSVYLDEPYYNYLAEQWAPFGLKPEDVSPVTGFAPHDPETVEGQPNLIFEGEEPSLSVSDAEVREGEGALLFTLSLSEPATKTVTVDVATEGMTATPGVDFTPIMRTVTFAPGEQFIGIPVAVSADAM